MIKRSSKSKSLIEKLTNLYLEEIKNGNSDKESISSKIKGILDNQSEIEVKQYIYRVVYYLDSEDRPFAANIAMVSPLETADAIVYAQEKLVEYTNDLTQSKGKRCLITAIQRLQEEYVEFPEGKVNVGRYLKVFWGYYEKQNY